MSSSPPPNSPEMAADVSLPELLRIMDVATALRRERSRAETELDRDEVERRLRDRLREAAEATGEVVTDAEIHAAIRQYFGTKHEFEPPERGFKTTLAHVYIRRGRFAFALFLLVGVTVLWWWLFYSASGPFSVSGREARALSAAVERVDAEESRLRSIQPDAAVAVELASLRARIEVAKKASDSQALQALGKELATLRDAIDDVYEIRVASTTSGGGRTAFRQDFTDDRGSRVSGFFLIVEAARPDGELESLPIRDAVGNRVESRTRWAEQVPEAVYNRLKSDKLADGVLDEVVFATKRPGSRGLEIVMKDSLGAPLVRGRQLARWSR